MSSDSHDESQYLVRPQTNVVNGGLPKLPFEPWWTLTNVYRQRSRRLQNRRRGNEANIGSLASSTNPCQHRQWIGLTMRNREVDKRGRGDLRVACILRVGLRMLGANTYSKSSPRADIASRVLLYVWR